MDTDQLRDQAKLCRRLAATAYDQLRDRLIIRAELYEAQAKEADAAQTP